ncbi:hypothetical protein [Bradyrhizobium sp. STM 3562]|uniref:hypothetical protein n=1 Tax=Bradyrhizobium sp. STM 3562 TaxID=578924 RepID=UPI00388D92BE
MQLDDLPGPIADRKRLRTMLAHLGRTLHVGFLNDCLFDAATALSLAGSPDPERVAPALSRRSPDRCPNACLTARHLKPWRASIAEGEAPAHRRLLSPLQRAAISRDDERKRRLIGPLTDGGAQTGPTSAAVLRAAMVRLLDGRPPRTNGALTVANLAREAGVSRATANRAADLLAACRAAEAHQRRSSPHALKQRIRTLEAALGNRSRCRDARAAKY